MDPSQAYLLLVDDNEDNLDLLQDYLEEEGFTHTLTVGSAAEAFEVLQHETFDLIIMDIMMPDIDGIRAVRYIRKTLGLTKVPILMATAKTDDMTFMESFNAGATDYIRKPITNSVELVVRVRNALALKAKIDAEKRLNAILREEKSKTETYSRMLEATLHHDSTMIAVLEEGKRFIFANQAFSQYFPTNTAREELITTLKQQGRSKFTFDSPLNDIPRTFEVKISRYADFHEIISLVDITDLERYCLDTLTGLYNRKIVKESLQNFEHPNFCILFFDIDDFKQINDTYGHLVGDEVLKKIGSTIKHNIRKNDIAIRWGGEEFLILLPGVTEEAIAIKIAETLRHKFSKLSFDAFDHPVTCSFGVCCGDAHDCDTFQHMLQDADKALYHVKQHGKDGIQGCEGLLD